MDHKKIILYLVLVIISFSLERKNVKCNKETLQTILISLTHHFFSVYIYFGTFIFKFYKFNLLVIFVTILGWLVNRNRCFLTLYYNQLCDIPPEQSFYDITYEVNKILKLKNLHYYILAIIMIYNIYMLLPKKT